MRNQTIVHRRHAKAMSLLRDRTMFAAPSAPSRRRIGARMTTGKPAVSKNFERCMLLAARSRRNINQLRLRLFITTGSQAEAIASTTATSIKSIATSMRRTRTGGSTGVSIAR